MFSGIVETLGSVVKRTVAGRVARLVVDAGPLVRELAAGESVAVNGACLTVEETAGTAFTVALSPQTRRETTLDALRSGERVNIERALKLGGRVGGHLVTGHIDFVTAAEAFVKDGDTIVCRLRIPREFRRHVARRGSLAIDGVSLTVAEVEGPIASIWLIPYTLSATTLSRKRAGDPLNIETDLLAKYAERLLAGDRSHDGRTELLLD